MKKYVITGGAGFIGSHIAEHLVGEGHEVVVLDSLRTGFQKNIDPFNLKFEQGDIRNIDTVNKLVTGASAIFHLAALVSVPESISKIAECNAINAQGTINILEGAKSAGNCKVILSSSAANYGDNPVSPKVETMTPEPLTPYSITKLDGEYYLDMYRNQFDVPTTSLRYFNVFGPRQNPKSAYAAVVPIFILNALQNKPLIIYGDGQQTRDFIYVKDVVAANLLASQTGKGVYNVALGNSTSVLELAEFIIKITNSKSEILFKETRAGDIKHSQANPEKFQKEGFKPKYSIEEGLKETVAFYESELLAQVKQA
ncbi:NAD-dependent epimerase/dehydratase family protein [Leeuwenhoekiella marinoflava]|uniref:UDP-glucose 4-epimerase n=2 Tax=Leeuwenhoekiella marinoflava TaxID=988 RepID=A0A4Q0P5H7_9FLAO|nr:NAD-dependent epimerase/dehydratase family protein [Leeuwenhoekiella marinoflava]RXG21870.1 UDP-glucose 4-epimerase [Leeuwenhoekiella marinoflava]SHG01054.1 UDP-glucose 4-epimerase [Leeuwenhoekiella marinoflava DSM 3653]